MGKRTHSAQISIDLCRKEAHVHIDCAQGNIDEKCNHGAFSLSRLEELPNAGRCFLQRDLLNR